MLGVTVVLLLFSMAAFYFKWVAVKMLPFDNKNEIQIVIDMPEGSTLEERELLPGYSSILKTFLKRRNIRVMLALQRPSHLMGLYGTTT